MKMGICRELLYLDWIRSLKDCLGRMAPGIEWVHDPSGDVDCRLLMDGDACYPFKKMVRSSVSLLDDVDALLIPRVVGLDGFLMCPNFRALPDMVRLNMRRYGLCEKRPVFTPETDLAELRHVERLAKKIYRDVLGEDIEAKGDVVFEKEHKGSIDRDISGSVALIGHPYLLMDNRLNNGVPHILQTNGIDTVTSHDIDFRELTDLAAAHDFYAKRLYWRPAREVLGAFIYFSSIKPTAGIIHLVPFNCGVDALIRIETMGLYKQMDSPPPYMVIVCDEHTQRDHVVTRVEAFLDIIHGIRIN